MRGGIAGRAILGRRTIRSRPVVSLALICSVIACDEAMTDSQKAISPIERQMIADSVVTLSRSVMEAGESLNVDAMVAWFRDGEGSAFGGGSGLMLSTGELRRSLESTYGRLTEQTFEPLGQRVVVLSSDAAVVTGLGNFSSTDTLGNRAHGNQTYTFVWTQSEGVWRIIQGHFSSTLLRVEPGQADPG